MPNLLCAIEHIYIYIIHIILYIIMYIGNTFAYTLLDNIIIMYICKPMMGILNVLGWGGGGGGKGSFLEKEQ